MKRKKPKTTVLMRLLATAALIVFSLPVYVYAAPVTFSDGTFDPANWELIVELQGTGGIVNVSQGATGGNPGAYRHIENTLYDPAPGGYSSAWGFHKRTSALYDPQTQGAITSIDYSEDSIMSSGFGQGQASGPALQQGGLIYYCLPSLYANQASWTTQSLTSLQAEDFSRAPWIVQDTHPDFSASGDPITFGFWRGNGTYDVGYTIVAGIDNWSITIVPEPTTLLLLGLGAIFLRRNN